jgi:hypothetical protein
MYWMLKFLKLLMSLQRLRLKQRTTKIKGCENQCSLTLMTTAF